jgi:hypothetical protein
MLSRIGERSIGYGNNGVLHSKAGETSMTTDTDKLVEMARGCGIKINHEPQWAHLRGEATPTQLAAFRDRIIASLCGDVEQDGFHLVSVNAGFTELLEALDRADRKGYMPDAIYSAYEGFECRDPASTVAALKAERDAALARVAELEKDAARYRWLRDEGNPYAILVVGNQEKTGIKPFYGIELDAAIDAALTKGQP